LNILGGKVEESSDAIGKIALGGVVAGAAIHAVASNISKRKDLNRRIREGEEGEKKIAINISTNHSELLPLKQGAFLHFHCKEFRDFPLNQEEIEIINNQSKE
jgi:peptidyl-tRNA hydrolase